MLVGMQAGYMGIGRKWLVPEMIRDPQELLKRHRNGEEGVNQFLNKCPSHQVPANIFVNRSNSYCIPQMPGAVAGTRDELRQRYLPSRSCVGSDQQWECLNQA